MNSADVALADRQRRLEAEKYQLLDAVLTTVSAASHPYEDLAVSDGTLRHLLRDFYRHVAPVTMLDHQPETLGYAPLSLWRFAQQRSRGEVKVRVWNPQQDTDGWSSDLTSVQIVTDDARFLVGSVLGVLHRAQIHASLVVHPQLQVVRDGQGQLVDVVAEGEDPVRVTGTESWMWIEISRVSSPERQAELANEIADVLSDAAVAVADWSRMATKVYELAHQLERDRPASIATADLEDSIQFMRWLTDDHFIFLGVREYELGEVQGVPALRIVPGSGLGILREQEGDSFEFEPLPEYVRDQAPDPEVLILTKANSISPVHRSVYLDYVGIKKFDEAGRVVGEYRVLGLYTSSAIMASVLQVPILRRRVSACLAELGLTTQEHNGRILLRFFETYPREEFLQVSKDELVILSKTVLHLDERRETRVFLRRDRYGRFVSALVYIPRDRYSTNTRRTIMKILQETYDVSEIEYTARVSESDLAQLHFVVHLPLGQEVSTVDSEQLEIRIAEATQPWDDNLASELVRLHGPDVGNEQARIWTDAFPGAYKADYDADIAAGDTTRLTELTSAEPMSVSFYTPRYGVEETPRRLKVYCRDEGMTLSDVMPVLQALGVQVFDEQPYEIVRKEDGQQRHYWVYDFGLESDFAAAPAQDTLRQRIEEVFLDAWQGRVESDLFNALVLNAGLTGVEVVILRAYAKYLRQSGMTFSPDYIAEALQRNLAATRILLDLFSTRFDPDLPGDRAALQEALEQELQELLVATTSLDDDRIIRGFRAVILATLRTNVYQEGSGLHGRPGVFAFKLNPRLIPDSPQPRPHFEIWSYSPDLEGVHLRFGRIARGGLRWSDRKEDFRTEVLGLVKAQAVKNSIIVPVGAKGGFIVKKDVDPSDRAAWAQAGVECYRGFISSLLSVTDNIVDGQVVPPLRTVRHDGDDTYLVVAADKGTARFSDVANEISQGHGFWLDDAFASGGSDGYDHKAMGITARGAWESVKRHFRELGVNTQTEDFTVVGIGDMSGDVFGNGMLLSEHIQLVGAFDHRDIFLDPNPDAARSHAERQRLFDLPGSSWQDYNRELISEGGGVYSRSEKAIQLSPAALLALGLPTDTPTMTPNEVIQSILRAPTDLLWNGGIGTYVKSSAESHLEVGDKGNDAIRIDGEQLRVRVVGEGGNLGFTQRGRIEAALKGIHINTDAIDNSAGVDSSDQEVNIKILTAPLVASGALELADRNELLVEMTDTVAKHVLRNNYAQNTMLGNARAQSLPMLPVHRRFIQELEQSGHLDRELEFLPSDKVMIARENDGRGLTSPELAVLASYSKMWLTDELLESDLVNQPWFDQILVNYFPPQLVERFPEEIAKHSLHHEIIVTMVANEVIESGGITSVYRAQEEYGASSAQIVRAFMAAREVFGIDRLWQQIRDLDNVAPTQAQDQAYLGVRRLLDRALRWYLQQRSQAIDIAAEIERAQATIQELASKVPQYLLGREQERFQQWSKDYEQAGLPEELSKEIAAGLDVFALLDIVELTERLAGETGAAVDRETALQLYFVISERFNIDLLLNWISGLERADRWSALARQALRSDLYQAIAGLTYAVLRHEISEGWENDRDPVQRVESWEHAHEEGLARARRTLGMIYRQESHDLATLSVALRTIRTLVP